MGVGEIGMSLKDFYSLTFNDYHYISKGYLQRDEREWQRMRMQTALLINVHLAKDKHVLPEDLFALPSDRLIKKKKPTPSKEDFQKAIERYGKK